MVNVYAVLVSTVFIYLFIFCEKKLLLRGSCWHTTWILTSVAYLHQNLHICVYQSHLPDVSFTLGRETKGLEGAIALWYYFAARPWNIKNNWKKAKTQTNFWAHMKLSYWSGKEFIALLRNMSDGENGVAPLPLRHRFRDVLLREQTRQNDVK